jgi:hypothetical protein
LSAVAAEARAVGSGRRLSGRAALLALAALCICAVLAVAALRAGIFGGPDTIPGNTGDPTIFIWCLEWVPFALSHHLNPLLTDYLHYPAGANLMWNTSIVFPALVLTPITVLAGPIAAYNLLTVLGMSLSGFCAYLAVRRYTESWLSAMAGGVLYEFCPFMAVQINGHAHLFIAVFPPLLVLFADEILVRRRHPARPMGLLLGFATACQLLTGTELLAISAVMAVPALITVAIIFRGRIRAHLPHALRAAGWALGTFVVLAWYPLYVLLLGPQRVHGILQGTGFVARPTSFLIPSGFELFGGPSTVLDSSVYIGIPLLLLAVVVTWWLRRRAAVVAAAVTAVSAMVLALGGHLVIHGAPTSIPLPWDIAQHLPILDNVLPVRLMIAGYLALAVILGIFLDSALRARGGRRAAGLAIAVVALVPLIPALPVAPATYVIPAYFSDGASAQLPANGAVLVVPYGSDTLPDYLPEAWQAVSGMAFRTVDGMVFTPGPGGFAWGPEIGPMGTELHALGDLGATAPASLDAADRQAYLADLSAGDVTAVVVGPSAGETQVVRFLTELMGRPGSTVGGVVEWVVAGGG